MTVKDELVEIQGRKSLLKAEDVLEWAEKHPQSEIYAQLEWDDVKAGHEYRLWQVRRIIALNITYEDGSRKMVSLTIDRPEPGGGYRDIDDVLRSKQLYEIMMKDALAELDRIERKYEALKQLKPVWAVVARIKGERRTERRQQA